MGLIRLMKQAKAASAINAALDDAARTPSLYREVVWWRRVLIAAGALVAEIPLSQNGQVIMNNVLAKLGMVMGTVVAVAGSLQSAPIPAKYQGIAAVVGSVAAMLSGLLHPAPNAATK